MSPVEIEVECVEVTHRRTASAPQALGAGWSATIQSEATFEDFDRRVYFTLQFNGTTTITPLVGDKFTLRLAPSFKE